MISIHVKSKPRTGQTKRTQKDFFFLSLQTTAPIWKLCLKNLCVNHVKGHSTPICKVNTEPISSRPHALRTCTALQQNHSLPQSWQSSEFSFQSGQSVHIHLSCIFLLHHIPIVDKLQKTAVSGGCSQNLEGKATGFSHHNRLWNLRTDKKATESLSNWVYMCNKSATRTKLVAVKTFLIPFRHQRQNYSNFNWTKPNPSSCLRRNARHVSRPSAKNGLDCAWSPPTYLKVLISIPPCLLFQY